MATINTQHLNRLRGLPGGGADTVPVSTFPVGASNTIHRQLDRSGDEFLTSALARIRDQFKLRRTALVGERRNVNTNFKQLAADLNRARRENISTVRDNSVRRGIFGSGIQKADVAEVKRDVAEAKADATSQRTQAIADIENALALLAAEQSGTEADVTTSVEDAILAVERQLVDRGLLEPTEAVDSVTEEDIELLLRQLLAGLT